MPLTIGDVHDVPSRSDPVDGGDAGEPPAEHGLGATAIPVWEEAHSVTQRPLASNEPAEQPEPVRDVEDDDGGLGHVRLARIVETTGGDLILNAAPIARETHDLPDMNGRAPGRSNPAARTDTLVDARTDALTADTAPVAASADSHTGEAPNSSPSAMDDQARTDEKSVAHGNVLANDTDADGDALHVVHAGGLAVPEQGLIVPGSAGGTFIIHRDGSYVFETGKDFHDLAQDEIKTTAIVYTVSDGRHASSTAVLEVTVTGTNDLPIVTPAQPGQDAGVVEEDGVNIAEGKLDIADADHDQSSFREQRDTVRPHGVFSIDAEGRWRYELNNDHPEVQALAQGETLADRIPVLTADGTKTFIGITINGTNDVPAISGEHTGQVTEDEDLAIAGQLAVSDIDRSDTHTWSVLGSADGEYGSIRVDAAGQWIYTVDPQASQSLAAGEQKIEAFTVQVEDSHGGKTAQVVTVTLTGANDVPAIGGEHAGGIIESVEPSVSGQLSVQDVDIKDTHAWSVQGDAKGDFGALTIDQTGKWTYTADDRVQALASGEQKTETFRVQVDDGHGGKADQIVTVTVTGTNNVSVVTGSAAQLTEDQDVTDDGFLIAKGQVAIVDADAGEGGFRSAVFGKSTGNGNKPLGTLEVREDGSYVYKLDNSDPGVQGLAAGQSIVETYVVTSKDGTGSGTITIVINGVNDTPEIKDSASEVTEDKDVDDKNQLTVFGKATITDADAGESQFIPDARLNYSSGNSDSPIGSLVVNPDGTYAYTVDNNHPAVQSLVGGESIVQAYKVTSKDGTAAGTITITINGTDDKPVITADSPDSDKGALKEDVTLEAAGKLNIADTDRGQSSFQVQARTAGKYGTFSIAADGKWKYVLNNDDTAVQSLGQGKTLGEKIPVLTMDGTETFVTIAIEGTNDVPAIGGEHADVLVEDQASSVSGQMSVKDVDIGDAHTWSVRGDPKGDYGTLTIDQTGKWTYTADDRVQSLAAGEQAAETFAVLVDDGHGGTAEEFVTIIVRGVNDAPVVGGEHTGALIEDAALSVFSQLSVKDVDIADSHTWSVIGDSKGNYGKLEIDRSGKWTYTPDERIQSLAEGEQKTESYTVLVDDGHGGTAEQSLALILTGTNDLPVISGESAGALVEDAETSVSGQLSVDDVDIGDSHEWSIKGDPKGSYGTLKIDQAGKWTYTADDRVQSLAAGEQKVETFAVLVDDGHGGKAEQIVTVTLTGTNDLPAIKGQHTGSIIEDESASSSSRLWVQDVDLGDAHTWSVVGNTKGEYGELEIDQTGTWTYTPDERIQSLSADEKKIETFTVLVDDGHGGKAEQAVTVTVTGTNDDPVVSGTATGSVTEDIHRSITHKLKVSDKDIGDTHTWTIDGPATGKYGSLSLDQDGKWTYTVNQEAAQTLLKGQKETDTFTVKVDDGHGGTATRTVTMTINGANDPARIEPHDPGTPPNPRFPGIPGKPVDAGDRGTVMEDNRIQAKGKLDIHDPDHGQAFFKSKKETDDYGEFTIDINGNWTYTLNNSDPKVQALSGKDSLPPRTFEVMSVDGTATHAVKINVIGTNDAPVSADSSTVMPIGGKHTFTAAEFKFQDSHGERDRLESVIITRHPDSGTLTLAGKSVPTNQPIPASDIAAGKLVYTPGPDSKDASFGFKVRDNGGTANGGQDTSGEHNFALVTNKLLLGTNGNEPDLNGGSGADIVVGDPGGTRSVVVPGNSYNIVMILDRSSSMERLSSGEGSATRIKLLQGVVNKLLESLGDHVGGTVNLLIINFSDKSETVVAVPDLKRADIKGVQARIDGMETGGGTNYVEPFKHATEWFAAQPKTDARGQDYHRVTYFVTDGDPRDLADGRTTFSTANILEASMEAFRPLSQVSSVYAVGMGESTNEQLRYFDNTPLESTRADTAGTAGTCGSYHEVKATLERTIAEDKGRDLDERAIVYTAAQELKRDQGFGFNFGIDNKYSRPVDRDWQLQVKLPNGDWKGLEGPLYSDNTRDGVTQVRVPEDGEYRLAFFRPSGHVDEHDHTKLRDIVVLTDTKVSGPACEPQIVKTARELESALSVGAFREEAVDVGRDHIDGGAGNDILLGDSINTDHLHSRNHPAGEHDGYGMQGLREFLADAHKREPTQDEIYDYIRQHHAELNKGGDMRGEADVIRGKDGNDIIYGQGGNDKLFGDAGNDVLIGGTGDDTMEGGSGSDTFVWLRGDGATVENPAIDTILDFDTRSRHDGGDVLDLRDLLPELARDDLSSFLHFDRQGEDTVIEISTSGSVRNPAAPNIDQKVVLQGVDLTNNQTLSDAVILNGLIQQGKLLTALSDANS